MSNELSNDDAQKLFNQISAAKGDAMKLDELFKTPDEGGNPDPTTQDPTPPDPVDPPQDGGDGGNPEGGEGGDGGSQGQEGNPPDGGSQPEGNPAGDGAGQEDDVVAKLREQIEKLDKDNHALRSQAGRVPHVQRRIKELEQRLEDLANKAASPANHPSATIQPKVLEALKGIQETDPDLAAAIAKAVETATSAVASESINREKEHLTLLRDQERAAYQAEQLNVLLEMVPNAREVVASPQWSEWKNAQSEDVVRLAESDDASSVALAMKLYGEAMKAKYPQLAADPAKKPDGQPSDEDAAKAAKIEQERQARQQKAASLQSPGGQGKVSLPDDPVALFNKFSEDIRKNM